MTEQPRPLPPYPPDATPLDAFVDPKLDSKLPHSILSPSVYAPTKYTTYVRALEDIKQDVSIPTSEQFHSGIKSGDIIKVLTRLEDDKWAGIKNGECALFKLDERIAPVLTGRARALWTRTADKTEELSFEQDEEIVLLHQQSNWWYWGELSGDVGLVPFNYIECIPTSGQSDHVDPSTLDSASVVSTEWTNDTVSTYKVRAGWSWEGTEVRDLSLKEDDIVEVISKFHKDWWLGHIMDRVGIFPSSFVTEDLEKKEVREYQPKRPPWYPYYVIALYPTTVEDPSVDLELREGMLISVEWVCSDKWWKGRTRDGKSGWFPENYVRPVMDRREPFGNQYPNIE